MSRKQGRARQQGQQGTGRQAGRTGIPVPRGRSGAGGPRRERTDDPALEEVKRHLDQWAKDLVDLGRRNTLLNYRKTKASTLEIEAPGLDELLRSLVNGTSRQLPVWVPPLEVEEETDSSDDAGGGGGDGARKVGPGIAGPAGDEPRGAVPTAPDEDGALAGKAKALPAPPQPGPDHLVTSVQERGRLLSILRNLERRSREIHVERGLWTLYVAVGMLQWEEAPGESLRSPLLLLPVKLEREARTGDWKIGPADDDPLVNPALSIRLEEEFGIQLPSWNDLEEACGNGPLDWQTVRGLFEKAIGSRPGWQVEDVATCRQFSFSKEAIYRDLKNHSDRIVRHDIVRTLALGEKAGTDFFFEPIPEEKLDEERPPENLPLILDADASQRRSILAALEGKTFVMDGPPGTGKSQTIANIIAAAMAEGRTILFVSEKMAALEAVKKRLDGAGLGHYLLELHSAKARRKEVAAELGRAVELRVKAGKGMPKEKLEQLRTARERLTEWAVKFNEVDEALGMSLHQAIGRELLLREDPHPEPGIVDDPASLDAARLAEIRDAGRRLGNAWDPVEDPAFPWIDLDPEYRDVTSNPETVVARLDQALRACEDLRQETERVAADAGIPERARGPRDAERLVKLAGLLSSGPELPPRWLSLPKEDYGRMEAAARRLIAMAARLRELEEEGRRRWGDRWRSLDGAQVSRLEHACKRAGRAKIPCACPGDATAAWFRKAADRRRRLADDIAQFTERARKFVAALGLDATKATRSLSLVESVAGLLAARDDETLPDPVLIASALRGTRKIKRAFTKLREALEAEHAAAKEATAVFTETILDSDPAGLARGFEQEWRGVTRVLRPAYWRARGALKACVADNVSLAEARERLGDAVAWKEARRRLDNVIAEVREVLGDRHLAGSRTDLEALEKAIDAAREMAELVKDLVVDEVRFTHVMGTRANEFEAEDDEELVELAGELVDEARSLGNRLREVGAPSSGELPLAKSPVILSAVGDHLEIAAGALGHADGIASHPCTVDEVREWNGMARKADRLEDEIEGTPQDLVEFLQPFFHGLKTDWALLASALDTATAVRDLLEDPVSEEAAETLVHFRDPGDLPALLEAWTEAAARILGLFAGARRNELGEDLGESFEVALEVLAELKEDAGRAPTWWKFVDARKDLAGLGLGEVVAWCERERVPRKRVEKIVEWAALAAWIEHRLAGLRELEPYEGVELDELARRFRELDAEQVRLARQEVIARLNARRPQLHAGGVGTIRREAKKKRRHMPVRDLLASASGVVRALKPCFLMSPLSVSQYLPPDMEFDLVIFDEASQVPPSDAINSIYRGHQLIVAGDEKQLPPTPFFAAGIEDGDDAWEEGQVEKFESLLDICNGSGGFPSLPLRWHYRSRDEHLVAFSNLSFYEGQLVTFPAPHTSAETGVHFHRVNGTYGRGTHRQNREEAAAVAGLVERHRKEHPDWTIGVVAFSRPQQDAILDALEERARRSPEIRALLGTQDARDGFFVKNLETVQGDERDIIVMSVGYGPDENDRMKMNFGPLNQENGWRRLNVAITRARQRVDVLCSFDPEDLQPGEGSSLRHLRNYLAYARDVEQGLQLLRAGAKVSEGEAESPFEEAVAAFLRREGYTVVHQVGTAGFRIDLAIRDPEDPDSFLLGIECDGAMYHSSRVARDRDRLRQDVLEGLGWRIYRVWGPAWYRNRREEEKRLVEAIRRAEREARGEQPSMSRETDPPEEPVLVPHRQHIDWTSPYKPLGGKGGRLRFAGADWKQAGVLEQAIRAIVEAETLVTDALLQKRLRELFKPRGRARFQEQVERVLDRLFRASGSRKLYRREDAWAVSNRPLRKLRVPREGNKATVRKAEEVPLEELSLGLEMIIRDTLGIEREEAFHVLCDLLGWRRLGPVIRARLEHALGILLGRGIVREATGADGRQVLEPVNGEAA